jgi:hypothetical protein
LTGVPAKKNITVKTISEATFILPDDVITALKDMGVVEQRKRGGAGVVINRAKVRAWIEANNVSRSPPVDLDRFVEV